MSPPDLNPPRIDGRRLLGRLSELAKIGATSDGGVTRLAYTDEDIRARATVARWLSRAGISSWVDQGGNLLARVQGTSGLRCAIATGSHLDTVVRGGRLDGAYGVIASVEAITAIAASPLRHDVMMVAFSNEEGANGTPGMVGSHIVVGAPVAVDRLDHSGIPIRNHLAFVGGDASALDRARWPPGSVAAFVEIHIEQGPVLESAEADIGVVTAITGRSNLNITVTGRQQHAGTTPMTARADALVIASSVIAAIDDLAQSGHVRVATTGHIDCHPNIWNVIPGIVNLTVDLRDTEPQRISSTVDLLRVEAARLANRTGATIDVRQGPSVPTVFLDNGLADCITAATEQLGLVSLPIVSGAGHDAQLIAQIAPTAMCFVPSVNGVSHAPEEHSHDHHLVAGANVLLDAIRLMDIRLLPTRHIPPWINRPREKLMPTGMSFNIGVFCGSRPGRHEKYVELGRELGRNVARRGAGLVYGAGGAGIMGAVANAAYEGGARVTGIVPALLYEREKSNYMPGELVVVGSMHERKALMYDLSSGFAILPGGFGTLDELLEVATWNQLGIHRKPIALINKGGFFNPLLALFDHLVVEGFLGPAERALVRSATDTESALDLIEKFMC